MALLCLFFRASGHNINNNHFLKIGDHVPDITIQNMLFNSSRSVKISDYKGKILVLDFWATWCSSCISHFPEMYALQKKIPDQLQILLVNCKSTRDSETNIKAFFEKRKAYYHFPTVVMDTALEAMFPHHSIPHYVWIKDNVLIAVTYADELNEANVIKALSEPKVHLPEKTFIPYDLSRPYFNSSDSSGSADYLYRSYLGIYKDGLHAISGFSFVNDTLINRIDVMNASRIQLIKFAFPAFAEFKSDRIILNVARKTDFSADSSSTAWRSRNCFCYESSFPPCERSLALSIMQGDIRKYLRVKIDTVEAEQGCHILSVADRNRLVHIPPNTHPETNINEHTGAAVYFINSSLHAFMLKMEDIYRVLFIDETAGIERVSLNLPPDLLDEKSLSESLYKQGFKLTKGKRKIKLLVISDDISKAGCLNQ
ncbi:Thiol-disulfide oxidoreductase ResA [Mucilaginibacter gotjawali]|nr:Thiol-disulfide oxidoreductase ResA [Mucilaginibacter gotjawali]